MSDDLLPVTSPALVRALDALEARLLALPVAMVEKDPWTVDADLLDLLAWENSVDAWDMSWAAEVKRRVIAAAAEVHKYKGTPYAIKAALAAFDVDTAFLEWFEPEGAALGLEAGSFRVTAYGGRDLYGASENILDLQMLAAMSSVVRRAAPVSRRMEFCFAEEFRAPGYLRTGARARRISRAENAPITRPVHVSGGPVLRSGVRVAAVSRLTADPVTRPAYAASGLALRVGARARVVARSFCDLDPRAAGVDLATFVRLGVRACAVSRLTHDIQRKGAG